MALDFGEPPAGTDLSADNFSMYNIVSCIFFSMGVLSVALRFYVRFVLSSGGGLGSDDYTIILALVCTTSTLFMTIYAAKFGSGQHVWAVTSASDFVTLLKLVYVEPWVYAASVTTTKASILLLYQRLFDAKTNTDMLYTGLRWIAMVLTAIYPIVMWIVMAVACRPISYYWEQYFGGTGTCINVTLFYLLFGVVNMINDIVILLVPIPIILRLNLSLRKKLSILGIMLLGSFVCVASIFRIYYLNKLAHALDTTWWLGPGFGWSCIEPSVAIVSACLPTFAPLFRKNKGDGKSHSYQMSASAHQQLSDRANSRNAASSLGLTSRNRAWVEVEEDEVGLTRRNETSVHSKGSDGRSIVVSTQVHQVSEYSVSGERKPF